LFEVNANNKYNFHIYGILIISFIWTGKACHYVTPLDAFKADAEVIFVDGYDLQCARKDVGDQMKNASLGADATIVVMGFNVSWEAEFIDRTNLSLPLGQIAFVQEVTKAAKNPIVLVILSAGGVDVSFARMIQRLMPSYGLDTQVKKLAKPLLM